MLPTPSWLKFMRWRAGQDGASSSGAAHTQSQTNAGPAEPQVASSERPSRRAGIKLVPRALTSLIQRALSPDVSRRGQHQHRDARKKLGAGEAPKQSSDESAPPTSVAKQRNKQQQTLGLKFGKTEDTTTISMTTTAPAAGEQRCTKSGEKLAHEAACLSGKESQNAEGHQSESCHLTAKTRHNECALHGRPASSCLSLRSPLLARPAANEATISGEDGQVLTVSASGAGSERSHQDGQAKREERARGSGQKKKRKLRRRMKTTKDRAKSVATWPLAKQTLDNNMPDELRLGHFGDCEDLLSGHLAGRLFGGLKWHLQDEWQKERLQLASRAMATPLDLLSSRQQEAVRLQDELSATNYNHRRPFASPYEAPPTSWLQNSLGLQLINPASSVAIKAKLFASRGFRRRSYDDQEGDNDINIILQPSDLDDIEKQARANFAQFKASLYTANRKANVNRIANATASNHEPPPPPTTTTTSTSARRNLDEAANNNESIFNHQANLESKANAKSNKKLRALTNIFQDIKLAKCLLDQDYNQTVRLFISKYSLNWNFNSFTFDALCCGRSLTELLLHLFDYYNFYHIFKLDIVKVLKCFRLLEFGYHSTNPYHNSVHAADVTQAMHCFIQENKIRKHMTHLEILCSILAAVCHDLDHPGVNQSFLVATNNPIASLYQNNSVLENHHWRFALCIFQESHIFEHFEKPILEMMKDQLKHLILATDIARQNEYLKRFRDLTSSHDFSMSNTNDRALVLQMALKCADLGNPCRPWLISRVWSNLICDEFYRMGQIERRLGVPLTPICQRDKTSIAGIQTDFFRFIVLPLLELWHDFLDSPLSNLLMSNFDHNYKRWQRANRIVQQLRRRKSVACLEPLEDTSGHGSCSEDSPANESTKGQFLEPYFDPTMQTLCSKHSFEAIKRASSDYIKSGNGGLELLRDFQLNRIIEKSPLISRAYKKNTPERNVQVLDLATSADKCPVASKKIQSTSGRPTSSANLTTGTSQQRKMLSPIEDGGESGPSPEVASELMTSCKQQSFHQHHHFEEADDGEEEEESASCSTPGSRASSACSSPIMQRVASRSSLTHEKSAHHHLKHFYEPSSANRKRQQGSKISVSSCLYNGKRRESDPGCPTDNYELAAAIVLLQYQNNSLFHKRRSSLPVCVSERRSSK